MPRVPCLCQEPGNREVLHMRRLVVKAHLRSKCTSSFSVAIYILMHSHSQNMQIWVHMNFKEKFRSGHKI